MIQFIYTNRAQAIPRFNTCFLYNRHDGGLVEDAVNIIYLVGASANSQACHCLGSTLRVRPGDFDVCGVLFELCTCEQGDRIEILTYPTRG